MLEGVLVLEEVLVLEAAEGAVSLCRERLAPVI